MIIEDKLSILITGRNKTYYINLGIEINELNICYLIDNSMVNPNSHVIEKRKCDNCGTIYEKSHQSHVKLYNRIKKDLCPKCGHSNIETQELRKQTCLKKYGVDSVAKLEEVKEKKILTNIQKYGFDNPMKNSDIIKKSKDSLINKYGENYRKDFAEKSKETFINKYGVTNPSQILQVKEDKEKKFLEKYGVKNPLLSEEIKEKIKNTCLKKYGYDNPLKSKEIQKKAKKAYFLNGKIPTSSQQKQIYDFYKNKFPDKNIQLNYNIDKYYCDIVFVDQKIVVEYDGTYWHKDRVEEDKIRDSILKQNGYTVIHICSDRKVPSDSVLEQIIINNQDITLNV